MSRPSTVRKPTATELRRVHHRLEKPLLPWQRRRAEVLLLHAADQPATRIAQLLQVHPNTVYADLHDFARHRLSCLNGPRTVGAPSRLSQGFRRWLCRNCFSQHDVGYSLQRVVRIEDQVHLPRTPLLDHHRMPQEVTTHRGEVHRLVTLW